MVNLLKLKINLVEINSAKNSLQSTNESSNLPKYDPPPKR